MDKLRAIQYFNRAAEGGSFAAAARAFDVSTPAVSHLVGLLERYLGVVLLHRSTHGISLTADGERYYDGSRKVTEELLHLEHSLGPRGSRPHGTLTVGMRHSLGQYCIMPRITKFLARFPDVELAMKPVMTLRDLDTKRLDLALMVGWPSDHNVVVRPLVQTRHVVCASPDYWMRAGRPLQPDDLADHCSVVFRGASSALLDRWTFEKEGDRRTIDVKGHLVSDDVTWVHAAACAGAGVIRSTDVIVGSYLASGTLVPVLTDWEALEAPTIFAAYPPKQRQSKLVRVFVDFLVEAFGELKKEQAPLLRGGQPSRVPKPAWFGRTEGRQSVYARKRIPRSKAE